MFAVLKHCNGLFSMKNASSVVEHTFVDCRCYGLCLVSLVGCKKC